MKSTLEDPLAILPPRGTGNGPIMSAPAFSRHGDDFTLEWGFPPVTMILTRVREGREGPHAELAVSHEGHEIHWGRLSLASTTARESVVKKLLATVEEVPWRVMVERACRVTAQASREGEPLVALTGVASASSRMLLPPLLYEAEATMIFGDGDTGKSLVAMALAVAVAGGVALPFGLRPARTVPVAYLDWEVNRNTANERLGLVAAGLGIDPPPILYRRMARPLVDDADALAADFARRGVGVVIIDSKMFAVAGGEGAAFHEPITAFYNALSRFAPAAALVINHVTNADARGNGAARPYGGAFAFNGPRIVWHAKRDREIAGATAIAFTCLKANNLAHTPDPFGLRFVPGEGTTTIYPLDLTEASATVVASASLTYRIRLALANGVATPEAVAKSLDAKIDTVTRILRRLRKDGQAREATSGAWEIVS